MANYLRLTPDDNKENGLLENEGIEFDEFVGDTTNNSVQNMERPLLIYKSGKTAVYFLTWIFFGISACIVGTTLPDFLYRIHIDNEEYGRLKMWENIISGTVGLLIGLNLDRFQEKTDLIISLVLIACGSCQILLPWSSHQYMALLLMILMNVCGFIAGGLGTSYNMAMWGESASLPLHCLYLGFPMGCMLGPLFARPFISSQPHEFQSDTQFDYSSRLYNDTEISLPDNTSLEINLNETSYAAYSIDDARELLYSNITRCDTECNKSSIEIPFGISGGGLVLCGLVFIVFYSNLIRRPAKFKLQRTEHHSFKDICNTDLWAVGKPGFGILILFVFIVFYSLLLAVEGPFTNLFLFTYAVKGKFKLSSSEAAYLDTSFKASLFFGRLSSLPVSYFCSIQVMIFVELVTACFASVFLATYGTHSKEYFWILICVLNFVIGPLWPAGYVWVNRYIHLYTSIIAIGDVFLRVSDGTFSWLVGYILEYQDPQIMWYMLSLLLFIILTIVTIGQIVACKYGERFGREVTNDYNVNVNGPDVDTQRLALLDSDEDEL